MSNQTKYKTLTLLVIAANSLLLTGSIVTHIFEYGQILLMQWCGVCGVFIIYRFNDMIDQSNDLKFNTDRIFKNKLNLIFLLQFFLISLPAFIYYLSNFRILILVLICLLGIIYSVNVNFKGKSYRLKNIFIIKNLYIGILWGGLILAGAGKIDEAIVIGLFIFICIQVFIGSSIRDIPDIELDTEFKVNSLPVVLGIKNTLLVLHLCNLLSILLAFLIYPSNTIVPIIVVSGFWRLIVLLKIKDHLNSVRWIQTYNLLTCFLILIVSVLHFYFLND